MFYGNLYFISQFLIFLNICCEYFYDFQTAIKFDWGAFLTAEKWLQLSNLPTCIPSIFNCNKELRQGFIQLWIWIFDSEIKNKRNVRQSIHENKWKELPGCDRSVSDEMRTFRNGFWCCGECRTCIYSGWPKSVCIWRATAQWFMIRSKK